MPIVPLQRLRPPTMVDDLRSELAELKAEVADLRHELLALRDSLGG